MDTMGNIGKLEKPAMETIKILRNIMEICTGNIKTLRDIGKHKRNQPQETLKPKRHVETLWKPGQHSLKL